MPLSVEFVFHNVQKKESLNQLTLYAGVCIGKGWSAKPYGTEEDHARTFVNKVNLLGSEAKPKTLNFLETGLLQRHNIDLFLVEQESKDPRRELIPVDDVNKIRVLSDAEIVAGLKSLASHNKLKDIDDKKANHEIAAELLADMFAPFAEAEGTRYVKKISPVWDQVNVSKHDQESKGLKHVGKMNWVGAVNEYKAEYDQSLQELVTQYNIEGSTVREGVDGEVTERANKKQKQEQFKLAVERLKKIAADSKNFTDVTDANLLKFISSIQYIDPKLLNQIRCRNYLLEEIAHMLALIGKGICAHSGRPTKSLDILFKVLGIPWIEMKFKNKELNHKLGKKPKTIPALTKKPEVADEKSTDSQIQSKAALNQAEAVTQPGQESASVKCAIKPAEAKQETARSDLNNINSGPSIANDQNNSFDTTPPKSIVTNGVSNVVENMNLPGEGAAVENENSSSDSDSSDNSQNEGFDEDETLAVAPLDAKLDQVEQKQAESNKKPAVLKTEQQLSLQENASSVSNAFLILQNVGLGGNILTDTKSDSTQPKKVALTTIESKSTTLEIHALLTQQSPATFPKEASPLTQVKQLTEGGASPLPRLTIPAAFHKRSQQITPDTANQFRKMRTQLMQLIMVLDSDDYDEAIQKAKENLASVEVILQIIDGKRDPSLKSMQYRR